MQVVTSVQGVCMSVCLSCGPTWHHCAKTAEQIKILFGVNTPEGPRNILLDGVLIPHIEGEGDPFISAEWLKLQT